MFVFAYLPQAAIMAFTSGPLAAITAALLTLSESSTLINLISRTFLIQDALIDTFDGTLVSRECTDLVSDGRQVKAGRDPMARLGKLMTKPLAKLTPSAIVRYLLYLPLNFIPVVGTVIFVLLQGKRNGPAAHARYFQLKGWSKTQREEFVEKNQGAYTSYVHSSAGWYKLTQSLLQIWCGCVSVGNGAIRQSRLRFHQHSRGGIVGGRSGEVEEHSTCFT